MRSFGCAFYVRILIVEYLMFYNVVDDKEITDWVRSAFLMPRGTFDHEIEKYRKLPDGLFKFSDTTLGGNQAINPLTQFTGFADINERRYTTSEEERYSFLGATNLMGRDYSERFDSNQVLLHMRMGVLTHNSMTRFFGNFYNPDAADMANKGRSNQIARTIGKIIGTVATFKIQPILLLGQTLRFLFDMPSTQYCYLKPTMHTYNDARSSMVNSLASNMGFVAGMARTERPEGLEKAENPQAAGIWRKIAPDVYNSNGSIDIYKVTTRYQRLANQRLEKLQATIDGLSSSEDALEAVAKVYRSTGYPDDPVVDEGRDLDSYVTDYFSLNQYKPKPEKETEDPNASETFSQELKTAMVNEGVESSDELYKKDDQGWWSELGESLLAEQRDGGQFVSFRIEKPSNSTISTQTSVKESGIQATMNGMSGAAKDLRFNISDGNVMGGPLGDLIGFVTDNVGALIGGVAESIGVSGLGMLLGNGFVDIPKHWEQTITNAPRINARMECRAWSSDPITRFQNLMVPAVSVMAAALPRSTGYQSYTSPFFCEYYCTGRGQSRLAMIDGFNMSIGGGSIPFTNKGLPLGYDLDFTLIDLSSMVHMPLSAGFTPLDTILPGGISKMFLSDQNAFTDLMAVLGSVSLVDQIYTTRRLKRNFHKTALDFEQWRSPARWASMGSNAGWLFGAQGGRMLSAFANPTDRG